MSLFGGWPPDNKTPLEALRAAERALETAKLRLAEAQREYDYAAQAVAANAAQYLLPTAQDWRRDG